MNSRAGLDEAIASFYRKSELTLDFIPRREFALMGWSNFMKRHKAFSSIDAIKAVLVKNPPKAFYASTARYLDPGYENTNPDKSSMENKEFICSDLAFDLDYTDLPNISSRSFLENLQEIANHTKRLIDDYLLPDLGITQEQLIISFSGGKGFHVRIAGQENIDKYARTHIQEFISGHKVEPESVFDIHRIERAMPELHLRETIEGGWGGKVTKLSWHYLDSIENMPHSALVESLKEKWPRHTTGPKKGQKKNCANKTVERVATNLKTNLSTLQSNGNITSALNRNKTDIKTFTDLLIQNAVDQLGCAIDLSVTKDVKKQLRVPGTFHGGSGMPCTVINYDNLKDIDSVIQTVNQAVGTKNTSFTLEKTIHHPLAGTFTAGEHKAPLYCALMALCAERNLRQTKKI